MRRSRIIVIVVISLTIICLILSAITFLVIKSVSDQIEYDHDVVTEESVKIFEEFCIRYNNDEFDYIYNNLLSESSTEEYSRESLEQSFLLLSEYLNNCSGFERISYQEQDLSYNSTNGIELYNLDGEIKYYTGETSRDIRVSVSYNPEKEEVKLNEIRFFR